jgi:hypothetical protein
MTILAERRRKGLLIQQMKPNPHMTIMTDVAAKGDMPKTKRRIKEIKGMRMRRMMMEKMMAG